MPANEPDLFLPIVAAASRGAAGFLDWTTGLLRLNAASAAWDRVSKSPDLRTLPARDRLLVETVTHETIHFLQIVTTGYLYRFAVKLFDLIRDCLPKPVRAIADIPIAPSRMQAARITDHIAALDRTDADGCSVRSLAECQAMLAQLRTHWTGLTHDGFLERTDYMPEVYRRAYRLATVFLGKDAFDSYPFLSSMALCCDDPVRAFRVLCCATQDASMSAPPAEDVQAYVELVNMLHHRGQLRLLGTAAEMVNDLGNHPVYTPAVHALNEVSGQGVLQYMAAPHLVDTAIATAVARPAVYNPDAEGQLFVRVPENWRPDLDRAAKDKEAEFLVFLMGISTRLLQNIATARTG